MAGGSGGAWLAGIGATIVAAIATAIIVPKIVGSAAVGGTLESVGVQSTNPCCSFAIRAKIVGYKGQECPFDVEVIDLDLNEHGNITEIGSLIPDADKDESTQTLPVRPPPGDRYVVRFFLYDPNRHEMDTKDSPTFAPVS